MAILGQVIRLKSQPQVKVSSQSSRVSVCPRLPHVYSKSTTPALPACLNKWLVFVTHVSVRTCPFSSYCLNIVKHLEACQRGNLGATSADQSGVCSQTEADGWNFSCISAGSVCLGLIFCSIKSTFIRSSELLYGAQHPILSFILEEIKMTPNLKGHVWCSES